jgi:hypothetical protein
LTDRRQGRTGLAAQDDTFHRHIGRHTPEPIRECLGQSLTRLVAAYVQQLRAGPASICDLAADRYPGVDRNEWCRRSTGLRDRYVQCREVRETAGYSHNNPIHAARGHLFLPPQLQFGHHPSDDCQPWCATIFTVFSRVFTASMHAVVSRFGQLGKGRTKWH